MEELNLQSILLPGIEDKRPLVISGPCSAETEEQVLTTAKGLAAIGIRIFRAGIWKPRTKPGGFEGVGTIGLPWLKRVKEETGMYVATEVATRDHVFEALKAGVDVLWVGARTAVNPFAMQDVADALRGVDIPVLVKNPIWSSGSAPSNAFTEQVSTVSERYIAGSVRSTRRCIVTSRSGILLSSCVAVCQTCPSFATPAISAVNAN